jgi:hypothetical protein
LLFRHDINTTGFVNITDTVALFSHEQHFWSERRANELSLFGTLGQHLSDGSTILGIKVRVDLIEEVKGCWIRGLDSKDESKGAKTCDAELVYGVKG